MEIIRQTEKANLVRVWLVFEDKEVREVELWVPKAVVNGGTGEPAGWFLASKESEIEKKEKKVVSIRFRKPRIGIEV